MSLPVPSNITCDVYRTGTAPPAAPAVAGLAGHLRADYRGGAENSEGQNYVKWTHVLLVAADADVRDGYTAGPTGGSNSRSQDTLYVPDQNGTKFFVVFVERVGRGSAADHKRVFLERAQPTWPTNDV